MQAVGRARLRRCLPVDDFLRAEADLLWDESEEALNCADALSEELSELERLQQQHGSQGDGLRSALILEPPLPPPVQAVQGLWRAKSGVRIRIHGMEVPRSRKVGSSKQGLQLGSKPFSATLTCGADETVDVLTWDDGDVWRRLAAPPPTRTSRSAASIWQAARRWRTLGTWRAEARRGEARWSSATELAKSRKARVWDPQSDDQSGATAWASAAEKADSAARAELWKRCFGPASGFCRPRRLRPGLKFLEICFEPRLRASSSIWHLAARPSEMAWAVLHLHCWLIDYFRCMLSEQHMFQKAGSVRVPLLVTI